MVPIVQMQNIMKSFPGVIANNDVSFSLYEGETHALVGENGAGKSTLMKILYGQQRADSGRIIINGDASGDNRSCTSEYTNYVIIKKKLLKYGYDVDIKIKAFNPPIKNRIAAFNAKVRSADGEICLYVDKKCEKLLYNIYNLKYREGSSKIDIPTYQQIKQSKELKFLSHPMDAASYLVDYYWPIKL